MKLNIQSVSPSVAFTLASAAMDADIPFFLHGSPGIGKSDLTEQLAKAKGMKCVVQMLTQMDATDLRGLQFVDEATQRTVNFIPEWLPTENDPPTMIFLDELPSAEPRLQVAAYQLLLARKIGSFVLHPKHYVCGAGNKVDDGAVVYDMGTALASRLLHLSVVAEPRSWLDWAGKNGIHPSVMVFIQLKGHMLEQLQEQIKAQNMVGPNPRNWARVSTIGHKIGFQKRELAEPLVTGLIGEAASKDFFLTVEEMAGLPDPRIILDLDDAAFIKAIPTKLPNLWGMAFSILAYCTELKHFSKGTKFFRLMVGHGPKTLPLEDVRKMGMEMLMAKADTNGMITEFIKDKELMNYIRDSDRIIKIGSSTK